MPDRTLTDEQRAEAQAAGDAALLKIVELFEELPARPHNSFVRYEVVIDHGEVRLVANEIDVMVEQALGKLYAEDKEIEL